MTWSQNTIVATRFALTWVAQGAPIPYSNVESESLTWMRSVTS
jgi:hypothetical protein